MNSVLAPCYKILGLPFNASLHEVKKVRRTLAKKWHPDLFHGSPKTQRQNEEKLKQVNNAADVLEAYLCVNYVHITATQSTEAAKRQDEEKAREEARAKAEADAKRNAERRRQDEETRRARAAEEAKAREEARARAEADAKRNAERRRKADVKQEYEQAAKWYHEAIKNGYKVTGDRADACGHLLTKTPKNYSKLYKWYVLAARRGAF